MTSSRGSIGGSTKYSKPPQGATLNFNKISVAMNSTKNNTTADSSQYNTDRPIDRSPVRQKHPLESLENSGLSSSGIFSQHELPKLMNARTSLQKPSENSLISEIEAERQAMVSMLKNLTVKEISGGNSEFCSTENIFKKYGDFSSELEVRFSFQCLQLDRRRYR